MVFCKQISIFGRYPKIKAKCSKETGNLTRRKMCIWIVAKDYWSKCISITNWKRHYKNQITYEKMHYLPRRPQGNSCSSRDIQHIYIILAVSICHWSNCDCAGTPAHFSGCYYQLLGLQKKRHWKTQGFHRIHAIIKSLIDKFIPYHWMKKGLIFLVYTIQIPSRIRYTITPDFRRRLLCLYLED